MGAAVVEAVGKRAEYLARLVEVDRLGGDRDTLRTPEWRLAVRDRRTLLPVGAITRPHVAGAVVRSRNKPAGGVIGRARSGRRGPCSGLTRRRCRRRAGRHLSHGRASTSRLGRRSGTGSVTIGTSVAGEDKREKKPASGRLRVHGMRPVKNITTTWSSGSRAPIETHDHRAIRDAPDMAPAGEPELRFVLRSRDCFGSITHIRSPTRILRRRQQPLPLLRIARRRLDVSRGDS